LGLRKSGDEEVDHYTICRLTNMMLGIKRVWNVILCNASEISRELVFKGSSAVPNSAYFHFCISPFRHISISAYGDHFLSSQLLHCKSVH
jgi:hypothetical protein